MLVRNLLTRECYWRGGEISSETYNSILERIRKKPTAPPGYEYQLSDSLEWVLCELPPDDGAVEELSAEAALDIILGGESL